MRRTIAILGCLLFALAGGAARAQSSDNALPPADTASRSPARPPDDVTTHHTLALPGRTLRFSASAGAIRLTDDQAAPRADIAFIAYQLEGADSGKRPDPANRSVTFVLNGGPGFASGWLQVGAVGPWRIPLGPTGGGDSTAPSASPEPIPNAETWLDFTDLVFIDPADTGFSRVLTRNEDARERFFSVDGDIASLAETIRLWLDRFDRNVSPKYLLGESYGGFRGPRLARTLATRWGTGLSGLVLISPALDFGGRCQAFDPFYFAMRLPSMAAAVRSAHGPVTREELADIEHYAQTEFLVDATLGERDKAAVDRRSARVAALVGVDPAVVARYHGLLGNEVFLRELNRASGRVGSEYDATVTSADPRPLSVDADYPDPVLQALEAPISSAMVTIYETRLNWHPDHAYRLESPSAGRQWKWGGRPWQPTEAMGAMREALALDPHLHVLIAQGLFDLVTPYFGTKLLLDQIPEASGGDRVKLVTYAGGHMFYARDAARGAFHDAARVMYGGE